MQDTTCRIPLSDPEIGAEELEAVRAVLISRWLTMGDVTHAFEEAFARFLGVPHCIAVCNGTAALHLAFQALGIGPGDEVICPAITFVATANAVLYTGAKPVFADIKGTHDLNVDPASIETKITPRTRAIVLVHYAGYPCDMKEILSIASQHNLKVVEDSAHAPGAEYVWTNGTAQSGEMQKIGSIGDVGCFSFFSNKNLVTAEGGMIATKDAALAARMRTLRCHGMTNETLSRHRGCAYGYDVVQLGYNYRIDELRSAIGLVQLRKLSRANECRNTLRNLYVERLRRVDKLKIPFTRCVHSPACHIFPVLLAPEVSRLLFMQLLRQAGVQTSIHYPPVHQLDYYRAVVCRDTPHLPKSEYVGAREVTLPLYPALGASGVQDVCVAVEDALIKSQTS